MAAPLSQRVADRIPQAASLYHRLVLIVGRPRTGKTTAMRELAADHGWPLANVNLELSERLLELTSKQRALRVARLLGAIADGHPGDVLLLDNAEILFSTELQLDPLRLLQGLSRNRTVVATWSGELESESLTYAAPGHPEHRRCDRPQVILVPAVESQEPEQHYPTASSEAGKEEMA